MAGSIDLKNSSKVFGLFVMIIVTSIGSSAGFNSFFGPGGAYEDLKVKEAVMSNTLETLVTTLEDLNSTLQAQIRSNTALREDYSSLSTKVENQDKLLNRIHEQLDMIFVPHVP